MTPEEFDEGIRNAMKLPDEECFREAALAVGGLIGKDGVVDGWIHRSLPFHVFVEKYKDTLLKDRQPQPKTT